MPCDDYGCLQLLGSWEKSQVKWDVRQECPGRGGEGRGGEEEEEFLTVHLIGLATEMERIHVTALGPGGWHWEGLGQHLRSGFLCCRVE